SGYRIQAYIKTDDGSFVKESFARSTSGTSYTMPNLKLGKEYKFEVTPRTNLYLVDNSGVSGVVKVGVAGEVGPGKEEVVEVDYPEVEEDIVIDQPVSNSSPTQLNLVGTTFTVTWEPIEEISRYRVQRLKLVDGEFVKDSYAKT